MATMQGSRKTAQKQSPQHAESQDKIDLKAIYHRLNRLYFGGKLKLAIEWYGDATKAVKNSRTLGLYDFTERKIQIHRILDQEHFPLYFLEYVVYHEMVHHVCPPKRGNAGRRLVHHAEYKRREKQFFAYELAKEWEKKNVRHLLNAKRSEGRKYGWA